MTWIEGYFSGPVYSTSFRSLAKDSKLSVEDEVATVPQAEPCTDEEKLPGGSCSTAHSTNRIRSHTEGEIQQSLQSANNRNLPCSAVQLAPLFSDQPTPSNAQTCGSTTSGEVGTLSKIYWSLWIQLIFVFSF